MKKGHAQINVHDLFLYRELFFRRSLFESLAAGTHHQSVGNDDLGCHQIGILGVVECLGNRFITQLEGIDLYRGELGRSKLGKQGIVERNDGNIFRHGNDSGCSGQALTEQSVNNFL